MSLLNFKGVRELTVDFDEHETNIFGANHTGKTTLFDAFVWLLFDKDSQDRQDKLKRYLIAADILSCRSRAQDCKNLEKIMYNLGIM